MDEHAQPKGPGQYCDEEYVNLSIRWIEQMVLEVESALVAGADVASVLDQPGTQEILGAVLTERYRRLAGNKIKHDGVFRESWIKRIFADFQFSMRQPERIFEARDASSGWKSK